MLICVCSVVQSVIGYIIKKRSYWPKGVPWGLTDTHFQDKEVSDVDILEARTQENKPFQLFFFKELYYVMKIMSIWMTLDELEVAKTIRDFTDSSSGK